MNGETVNFDSMARSGRNGDGQRGEGQTLAASLLMILK